MVVFGGWCLYYSMGRPYLESTGKEIVMLGSNLVLRFAMVCRSKPKYTMDKSRDNQAYTQMLFNKSPPAHERKSSK